MKVFLKTKYIKKKKTKNLIPIPVGRIVGRHPVGRLSTGHIR